MELEDSPRPLSLERNYNSKLSFVSHNRRSSFNDTKDLSMRRTESAPEKMLPTLSSQSSTASSSRSRLSSALSTPPSDVWDEADIASESLTRRVASPLADRYSIKTVASRSRGSDGSINSTGLSEELRKYAVRSSFDNQAVSEEDVDDSDNQRTPVVPRRESKLPAYRPSSTRSSMDIGGSSSTASRSPRIPFPGHSPIRRDCSHSPTGRTADGTSSPKHSASPPLSPALSRHASKSKIGSAAAILRDKRRQASGPYHSQVHSVNSEPASPTDATHPPPNLHQPPVRRQRSRHGTRLSALQMFSPTESATISALDSYPWHTAKPGSVAPDNQWHEPSRDVLMTPTTEEWTSYGGSVGSRLHLGRNKSVTSLRSNGSRQKRRRDAQLDSDTSDRASSSSDGESDTDEGKIEALRWRDSISMPPGVGRLKSWSSFGIESAPKTPAGFDAPLLIPASSDMERKASPNSGYVAPSQVQADSSAGLALFAPSRSSLDGADLRDDAIPLVADGPIDPKRYSARTGARSIASFHIRTEAGKGAYGTVVKARELCADGFTEKGPEIIIKYIVKQRILADCWKKHKILGPIPVEIHVLDLLRRIPAVDILPPMLASPTRKKLVTGHPNICSILDFFEDAEHYYLCMPCPVKGQDLFDYVDSFPDGLPISEAQHIATQLASAIAFLHMHGIVHRDIKDENVTLDENNRVQLIDFGSAAYIKEGRKFDTFSGTLDFAAPEVLRGERYDGKETDIWAFGVLLYVLICGECPFWGSEEAVLGLGDNTRASAALRNKLQPISSVRKPKDEVLEDAIDLIRRCLEVNAENRPSASEICQHWFILRQCPSQYTHLAWRGRNGWKQVA